MPELTERADDYDITFYDRTSREMRMVNKAINAIEHRGRIMSHIRRIKISDNGKAILIVMDPRSIGRRTMASFAEQGLICIATRCRDDEFHIFFSEALVRTNSTSIIDEIEWSVELMDYGGSDGWGYD